MSYKHLLKHWGGGRLLTSHSCIESTPKVAIHWSSGCIHKDGCAQKGSTPTIETAQLQEGNKQTIYTYAVENSVWINSTSKPLLSNTILLL